MNPATVGQDWNDCLECNRYQGIIPDNFDKFIPLLTPGLLKLATKHKSKFIEFTFSDPTWKRLDSGDDTVYDDIINRYLDALDSGLETVEL